jgi:hypothetical protein
MPSYTTGPVENVPSSPSWNMQTARMPPALVASMRDSVE